MFIQIVGFIVVSNSLGSNPVVEGPAFLRGEDLFYMNKLGDLIPAADLEHPCLRSMDPNWCKWP